MHHAPLPMCLELMLQRLTVDFIRRQDCTHMREQRTHCIHLLSTLEMFRGKSILILFFFINGNSSFGVLRLPIIWK